MLGLKLDHISKRVPGGSKHTKFEVSELQNGIKEYQNASQSHHRPSLVHILLGMMLIFNDDQDVDPSDTSFNILSFESD